MATCVVPPFAPDSRSYAVTRRAEQRARQLRPHVQVARCRVPGSEGTPTWVVASASRPGHFHLVWLGQLAGHLRLLCGCEARTKGGAVTCYHAQAVRLQLRAGFFLTPEYTAALGRALLHKQSVGGQQLPASPYTPRRLEVPALDLADLSEDERAEYGSWADHLSGDSAEGDADERSTCTDCGEPFDDLPAGEVVSGLICSRCTDRRREGAQAFNRATRTTSADTTRRTMRKPRTGGELPTRAPEDRPNTRRTTISRPSHASAPPARDDRPFSIFK